MSRKSKHKASSTCHLDDMLKSMMRKVLAIVPGSRSATVWIQRPLQAGIQIEAGVNLNGVMEYVIVDNDEEFLSFVQAYESKKQWNRMTLHMDKDGKMDIKTSFDEALKEEALKMTK